LAMLGTFLAGARKGDWQSAGRGATTST
jgi:hypothetical protein